MNKSPIIINQNTPYKTHFGLITYEDIILGTPNKDDLYSIKGYYTIWGGQMFSKPLMIKLENVYEYISHGNGD